MALVSRTAWMMKSTGSVSSKCLRKYTTKEQNVSFSIPVACGIGKTGTLHITCVDLRVKCSTFPPEPAPLLDHGKFQTSPFSSDGGTASFVYPVHTTYMHGTIAWKFIRIPHGSWGTTIPGWTPTAKQHGQWSFWCILAAGARGGRSGENSTTWYVKLKTLVQYIHVYWILISLVAAFCY